MVALVLVCCLAGMLVASLAGLLFVTRRIRRLNQNTEQMRRHAQAAERGLRESAEYYRIFVEGSPDCMALADLDGSIFKINEQGAALYGYGSSDELVGVNVLDLIAPADRQDMADTLHTRATLQTAGTVNADYDLRRRDGSEFPAEVRTMVLVDEQQEPCALTFVARDITERKVFQNELEHQALHDALTGLPNRVLLNDRLALAVSYADRMHRPVSLLLMDLDRFKEINDTFGHGHGDRLLEQVAQRVQSALYASDTVARLGGDEFAALLPSTDEAGAKRAAQRISDCLEAQFELGDVRLSIHASIGIAVFPQHGHDAQTLLRRADVAMYLAKHSSKSFEVYSFADDAHNKERLLLSAELRAAIESDQMLLHYQPKVHCRQSSAPEVEALVRWQHPEHGTIPPDQFISLAEQTGLMDLLTVEVLGQALEQCKVWQQSGIDMRVSVNMSAYSLQNPQLTQMVAQQLRKHGVEGTGLEIEVTESAVMENPERAIGILSELRGMGIRISIDDFGTGYSSLAYLARLPVDEIKIDKSFVLDMVRNGSNASIVRSVIDLGHSLNLQVVAEGVEDLDALKMLIAMGCDVAQGYHVSRPLPAAKVAAWLETWDPKSRPSPIRVEHSVA